MNENLYNKLIKQVLNEIKENNNIFQKAINCELQDYGHKIDLQNVKEILKQSNNILNVDNFKNKNIAVQYNGDIEITIQLILFALKNDVSIHLYTDGYQIINSCFITLILECMKDLKIKNDYIYYDEKYDESYLREYQGEYIKIIYIGEPFEYEKFKYFINTNVFYWNHAFYKIFIDKTEFSEEYKNIIKFAYMQNIGIEVFEEKNDFIQEVNNLDKVIIYSKDEAQIRTFKESLSAKEIIFNEFPYEGYRFKINDLLVKL